MKTIGPSLCREGLLKHILLGAHTTLSRLQSIMNDSLEDFLAILEERPIRWNGSVSKMSYRYTIFNHEANWKQP